MVIDHVIGWFFSVMNPGSDVKKPDDANLCMEVKMVGRVRTARDLG